MRRTTVGEIMSRGVATALPDTPLAQIAGTLAQRQVGGLPVVHPVGGRVLGVVSASDLAGLDPAMEIIAAEVMSTPAVTVTADASAVEAARTLAVRGVNRLPVVNRDGTLIGIVARADLLGVFLRPDAATRAEIRDVLARRLGSDAARLRIEVHDGAVYLGGALDRRSRVELAVLLASAVEGVCRVIEGLEYEEDDT